MRNPPLALFGLTAFFVLGVACSSGLSEEEVQTTVDEAVAEAVAEVSAQPVPGGVVTATEFRLVDEQGVLRASLNFDESGTAGLQIFDRSETPRIQIFASDAQGASGISLADNRGVARLDLFIGDQGEPAVLMFDQRATIRGRLALNAIGVPGLFFHDIGGAERSIFGQAADGSGSIAMFEPNGRLELVIPEEAE